jgi:Glycosyltransferase family 87
LARHSNASPQPQFENVDILRILKSKFALYAYIVGILVVHGIAFWNARHLIARGRPDFSIYYCAGTMVRRGLAPDLYSRAAQYQVQLAFAPDIVNRHEALPYNHPPFEALLFAPLTYLPYVAAFTLWNLLNLAMLMTIPFLLRRHSPEFRICPWYLWLLGNLAFVPSFLSLLHGQDSILLLFLYSLAFLSLKKNSEAAAGGWLALGLFRPQLVLPFVLFWVIAGSRKILYGFIPTGLVLALLSLATVGFGTVKSYPSFVLRLDSRISYGPEDMPNFRGMLYLLTGRRPYAAGIAIALSCIVVVLVGWLCRSAQKAGFFEWQFSLAVVATAIVSYHCLPYNLCLLSAPIVLVLVGSKDGQQVDRFTHLTTAIGLGVLCFSPLQLYLSRGHHFALIGWAVLLFMSGIFQHLRRLVCSKGPWIAAA